MSFNPRSIKLGRLFMVAWLGFFLYPVVVLLTGPFTWPMRATALPLLVGSGLLWAWYWTRICAGPDARFGPLVFGSIALLIGIFTLMTPAKYGTFVILAAVLAGAEFRWRRAVPLIVLVAFGGGVLDIFRGVSGLQAGEDILNSALVGFAALAGRLLIEANQQLSLAREQIARLAVGEERLRFARDLHDLLGHSLSVIALKSELAGRLIKASPGLAAHEVEDIEQVARDALREVREAVTGYRQPSLNAEVAGARDALTAAGIELRAEGEHMSLPPAVEAVLAWAVREGVTNVMRHSQAERCAIRIFKKDGSATVEIVDDGQGGTPEPGSGLRGLRERVLERGGTLTAEPLPHEGFRLRVTVPLPEVTAPVDRVTA
jgi:two-component system, NarL family, sensor histidine kinase DesK